MQPLFTALLLYTWALQAFVDRPYVENQGADWLYVLTVAPTILYVLVSPGAFLRTLYSRGALALMAMTVAVVAVSVFRADYATAVSNAALCLMLVAIRHTKVHVSVGTANSLLFASIAATAALNALGFGHYALLPGMDEAVAWRVSLFAYNVTPSWMLAIFVFGLNAFHNRCRLCAWAMMGICSYFIAFSASRTGLIVMAMCALFLLATKVIAFRERMFYRLFIPCMLALLIVSLSAEQILDLFGGVNNDLANAVLFKSTDGARDAQQASASIMRPMIWAHHVDLFLENIWIGHGSVDYSHELQEISATGSESFLTGLFARIGLLATLFVYFLHRLGMDAAARGDRLGFCLALFFAISAVAYGSYIVPYDFVFLFLFGAMNHDRRVVGVTHSSPPPTPQPHER